MFSLIQAKKAELENDVAINIMLFYRWRENIFDNEDALIELINLFSEAKYYDKYELRGESLKIASEKAKGIEAGNAASKLKANANAQYPSTIANAVKTFGSIYGFASGGMVPKYMASGGIVSGTDTVPTMLTPGEFVVNKKASQTFGPLLSAINSPTFKSPDSMSSSIRNSNGSKTAVNNSKTLYNYNLSVNVSNSNANPNDIARTVINQIKMIEDQRIRRY